MKHILLLIGLFGIANIQSMQDAGIERRQQVTTTQESFFTNIDRTTLKPQQAQLLDSLASFEKGSPIVPVSYGQMRTWYTLSEAQQKVIQTDLRALLGGELRVPPKNIVDQLEKSEPNTQIFFASLVQNTACGQTAYTIKNVNFFNKFFPTLPEAVKTYLKSYPLQGVASPAESNSLVALTTQQSTSTSFPSKRFPDWYEDTVVHPERALRRLAIFTTLGIISWYGYKKYCKNYQKVPLKS